MRERDGYVPGVPCWIDTSQPDPRAAVAFYSELFGWDCENVLPPGSPGEYFIARLDGCDVAAGGPRPAGCPAGGDVKPLHRGRRRRRGSRAGGGGGWPRARGAVRRLPGGPHG